MAEKNPYKDERGLPLRGSGVKAAEWDNAKYKEWFNSLPKEEQEKKLKADKALSERMSS